MPSLKIIITAQKSKNWKLESFHFRFQSFTPFLNVLRGNPAGTGTLRMVTNLTSVENIL